MIVAHCTQASISKQRHEQAANLDSDVVLQCSVRCVDGDLVVGLVAVLNRQIVVLDVDVQIRFDQLQASTPNTNSETKTEA